MSLFMVTVVVPSSDILHNKVLTLLMVTILVLSSDILKGVKLNFNICDNLLFVIS